MDETTNPVHRIPTIPNMPTVKTIKLPEDRLPEGKPQPLFYAPITINITKPAGLMLGIGIFLFLSVCTISNIGMLIANKVIAISLK